MAFGSLKRGVSGTLNTDGGLFVVALEVIVLARRSSGLGSDQGESIVAVMACKFLSRLMFAG